MGIQGMITVMDRQEITAEVAARLIAGQFPQWAELSVVPVGLNGWDNTTFRLGSELSVRLPSGEDYVAQVSKEHRWLPVLAGQLPLPIPEPVALGRLGRGSRGRGRFIAGSRASRRAWVGSQTFLPSRLTWPGSCPRCMHRRQGRAAARAAQRLSRRPAYDLG